MNELYLVYISVSIREISSIMILSTIQISKERQKCESVKSRKAMRGGKSWRRGGGKFNSKFIIFKVLFEEWHVRIAMVPLNVHMINN